MNTFFKTFFACLILTLGFLAYKFVGVDSYSPDLEISKNNPIFGIHDDNPDAKPIDKNISKSNQDISKAENTNQKYIHNCYFYSQSGELIKARRELSFKPSLENAIIVLLKGPTIAETKRGVYSEIPPNVDLLSVRQLDKDIIIDLSSNFGNGGGSNSVINRINQLTHTVKLYEPHKNVYLYINGKEVEYLGGDGVYIKQPLD